MSSDPSDYYSARASEYERIYAKPERQADLRALRESLPARFEGRSVLEVACGTGYWTQFIASSASHVLATDLSEATLQVARSKGLPADRVTFRIADAMALPEGLGTFDAVFAGFLWSHIPRRQIGRFLDSLHARLEPGARVVLLDNLYVEGSSTPIAFTNEGGDSVQIRSLEDGSKYEVPKNFPDQNELRMHIGVRASDVRYRALDYYWVVEYVGPPR